MAAIAQDRPDIQVFGEIAIIEHLVRTNVLRHLPAEMTYTQFELLVHFTRVGDGQTPAEIAAAMQMTKGAITNALQRMQAQGWIAVLGDVSDRRKKRVRITRQGLAAKDTILRRLRPQSEALRSGFTEDEFRAALPFLSALRAFLEEMRLDGAYDQAGPADDADDLDRTA